MGASHLGILVVRGNIVSTQSFYENCSEFFNKTVLDTCLYWSICLQHLKPYNYSCLWSPKEKDKNIKKKRNSLFQVVSVVGLSIPQFYRLFLFLNFRFSLFLHFMLSVSSFSVLFVCSYILGCLFLHFLGSFRHRPRLLSGFGWSIVYPRCRQVYPPSTPPVPPHQNYHKFLPPH